MKKLLGGAVVAALATLVATVGFGGVAGASVTNIPIPVLGTVQIISTPDGTTSIAIPLAGVASVGLVSYGGGAFVTNDCAGVTLTSAPADDASVCYLNGKDIGGNNINAILLNLGTGGRFEISLNPLAVCTVSGCIGPGSLPLSLGPLHKAA
jgi:hypothetical protein